MDSLSHLTMAKPVLDHLHSRSKLIGTKAHLQLTNSSISPLAVAIDSLNIAVCMLLLPFPNSKVQMSTSNSRHSSVNSPRQSTVSLKNAESGVWQGLSFVSPSLSQPGGGKLISPRYVKDQGNTRRTVEPDYPAAPPPQAPRKKLIPSFEHQSRAFKEGGEARSPPGRR